MRAQEPPPADSPVGLIHAGMPSRVAPRYGNTQEDVGAPRSLSPSLVILRPPRFCFSSISMNQDDRKAALEYAFEASRAVQDDLDGTARTQKAPRMSTLILG